MHPYYMPPVHSTPSKKRYYDAGIPEILGKTIFLMKENCIQATDGNVCYIHTKTFNSYELSLKRRNMNLKVPLNTTDC